MYPYVHCGSCARCASHSARSRRLREVPPVVSANETPRASCLLIVDDEEDIRDLLARYFQRQGFAVELAADAAALRARFADPQAAAGIDLVLLDLGLPGEDGLDLTRWLRGRWQGPVIMVTGRGDAVDRIVGLELGADDYVAKPFELRELLARVRSVLRRSQAAAPLTTPSEPKTPAPAPAPVYTFDGWQLDLATRQLHDPGGVAVALTSGELALLTVLLDSAPRVLSRDQLMNALHGRDSGPYDRAIDMQVGRLRRKIESDPSAPQRIRAVRGAGYVFSGRVQRHG